GWCINAVETGVCRRRRANTHVYLFCPSLPDHMHQFLAGGATYNRIVHYHNAFTLQKTLDGVQFNFDPKMPNGLLRINERASNIMIADEPCIKGNTSLLRIPQGRRNAGVRNGNDHIGLYGSLMGQLPPKRLADEVHVVAKNIAVRTRKIDQLEDALTGW